MEQEEMFEEFKSILVDLQRTSTEKYLGMVAIIFAKAGEKDLPLPKGYSRGDFKRAIRSIRILQNSHPEYNDMCEDAVTLIRRDWLHRANKPDHQLERTHYAQACL